MKGHLKLSVERDQAGAKISVFVEQEGYAFVLLGPCCKKEELEEEIGTLSSRLDALFREAKVIFEEIPQGAQEAELPETPDGLWTLLQRKPGLEEMKSLFNSLPEGKRREVADFILSHVNVFKGPGATFAQHYDEDSASLV